MKTLETILAGFTIGQMQDIKTFLIILEREKIPVSSFINFMLKKEVETEEIREKNKKASKMIPTHCNMAMILNSDPIEPKDSFWECRVCKHTVLNEGKPVNEIIDFLALEYDKKKAEG